MMVQEQEHDLWVAGAGTYAREDYEIYMLSIRNGRDQLVRENQRFVWFRNYGPVQIKFKSILNDGNQLAEKIKKQKELSHDNFTYEVTTLQEKINTLKKLTLLIGNINRSRSQLTRAELLLNEAGLLAKNGHSAEASSTLKEAASNVAKAIELVRSAANRFMDVEQLKKWIRWVDDTIKESMNNNRFAVVVNKSDRRLTLYKAGRPYRTYEVGLGFNGMSDKIKAGDRATPEGRYYITKKLPQSRFHKALLINYPNSDDRQQFALAKKKGLIPKRAGIGGLIEIHGGSSSSLTYGCVALDNTHMDELYMLVSIGTPVTIVGAVGSGNSISDTMKDL